MEGPTLPPSHPRGWLKAVFSPPGLIKSCLLPEPSLLLPSPLPHPGAPGSETERSMRAAGPPGMLSQDSAPRLGQPFPAGSLTPSRGCADLLPTPSQPKFVGGEEEECRSDASCGAPRVRLLLHTERAQG